ncbi:MAG: SRPBCC domain-containing protein [Bdellovibrio sp.]
MRNQSLLAVFVAAIVGFTVFFYTKKEKPVIRTQRTIVAPVEKIWEALSNSEKMKLWWGPKTYSAPVVKTEFHEGGSLLLAMEALDGKKIWSAGRFRQIVPNKHLKIMMYFSDENARPVSAEHYGFPGKWPTEVTITIDLESLDGKTTIKVREDGIPIEMAEKARIGWEEQLDKLEILVK